MPTISMFYGIIIRMYYAPKERPPPHFHVYYSEYKATIDIRTCEIIQGDLPKNNQSLFWHGLNFIKRRVNGGLGTCDE